jgi:uroporphyrinogen-III decarboxylase
VAKVLDGFLASGVDVLHPLEPAPMGDVVPKAAKNLVRGRICIEGNIQIADMYEKPPEQIAAHTAALIEGCFDDRRGLIVSPTASLYIRGEGRKCLPQVKAMVDTVINWQA